ncbi:hypothetical protein [Providencia sp.]|uniref:hypothetical protein n=1 Tax=Providencia sp. TaxID=589 RepID=UPI0033427548
MSIYVNTVVKRPFSLSGYTKTCSKINHLIKGIKNTNTPCIKLNFNHKHIELDKHNLLNNLKGRISAEIDYKTFEAGEKTLQISSAINSVIDETQAIFLPVPKKNQVVIDKKDKSILFKNIQRDCGLQESDMQLDAAQPFTKQLIQNDTKVKEAIHYLKLNTKNIDLNKINADSKATTKYVVEVLNDTVCKDFYPNIDFGKIRESAAKNTRSILEKKHYQRIDFYILRTEGTAV